jgi:hypothetical protein
VARSVIALEAKQREADAPCQFHKLVVHRPGMVPKVFLVALPGRLVATTEGFAVWLRVAKRPLMPILDSRTLGTVGLGG